MNKKTYDKTKKDYSNWSDERIDEVRKAVQSRTKGKDGITSAAIARRTGISGAAISQFLSKKYRGANDRVASKLEAWLQTELRKESAVAEIPDGPGFILTPTAEKIMDAIEYAHFAPDIAVIYGGAGVGKTETIREYTRNNSGVCLSTMTAAHSTVPTTLREIGKCVGLRAERDTAATFDALWAKMKETGGVIIVDEAQHLNANSLDIIRQIHDAAGCGVVFLGNEEIYSNMTGGNRAAYLSRLFSRVGRKVFINRPTEGDVNTWLDAWGISDKETHKLMCQISLKPGGLRGANKVIKLAMIETPVEEIRVSDIRRAWKNLGGE